MPNSAELLGRHFEKAGFGGYKAADVEAFIDDIRTYMSAQNKEIADLKRKLDEAVKKSSEYASKTESLKNTLLNAQIVADKTIADAKKEAEKLIADAKTEAAASLSSTKIKVENMLDCAESEVKMRKEEAESIKAETYEFKLKLMKLYRAQIELINEIPAEKPVEISTETSTETPTEASTETDDSEEEVIEETKTEAVHEEVKTQDVVGEPAVVKPEPIENTEKTDEAPKKAKDAKPEEKKPEEEAPIVAAQTKTEEEAAPTQIKTVKLNLRYNEKTGEYEPLGAEHRENEPGLFNFGSKKGKNGDGLKFGADYNIRTDSFNK